MGDGRTNPIVPEPALHETGVCRFGNDPKTSVTNKWAQTHDVPNLYICDASIFPSCTDKTTTMPIVAFTMRELRPHAREFQERRSQARLTNPPIAFRISRSQSII